MATVGFWAFGGFPGSLWQKVIVLLTWPRDTIRGWRDGNVTSATNVDADNQEFNLLFLPKLLLSLTNPAQCGSIATAQPSGGQ